MWVSDNHSFGVFFICSVFSNVIVIVSLLLSQLSCQPVLGYIDVRTKCLFSLISTCTLPTFFFFFLGFQRPASHLALFHARVALIMVLQKLSNNPKGLSSEPIDPQSTICSLVLCLFYSFYAYLFFNTRVFLIFDSPFQGYLGNPAQVVQAQRAHHCHDRS